MAGIKIKLANGTNFLKTAGYTMKQEEGLYDAILEDVYLNARWYIDNLDYISEFRVSWQNYRCKKTLPHKFVRTKERI